MESNRFGCPSPYDIIQLFQIQDMGRWTTFPMILGLRAGIKERTLAADNRLLEYCLSTPPDSRFASRLYKRALRELDPAMAHLPNANEYLPADLEINPWAKGAWLLSVVAFYRGIEKIRALAGLPRNGERPWMRNMGSWPHLPALWRDPRARALMSDLLDDPMAMRDGIIDPRAVRAMMDEHASGHASHSASLATLATFLEWRRAT